MSVLGKGTCVVVNLGKPREQVFGILEHLDSSGAVLLAISIEGVDDWIREVVAAREEARGASISLAVTFFPMHRIERIVLDEKDQGLPSIHQRFEERVGRPLVDWAREHHPEA